MILLVLAKIDLVYFLQIVNYFLSSASFSHPLIMEAIIMSEGTLGTGMALFKATKARILVLWTLLES